MPKAKREQPPHSGQPEAESTRIGGAGGVGKGLVLTSAPVPLDNASIVQIKEMKTAAFCKEYELCDDICQHLVATGFSTINTLLEIKENELMEMGFKVGEIAEIRWALKKMLLKKYPTIQVITSEGDNSPSIEGGIGGIGGAGGRRGGPGGDGKAPTIAIEDLFRFSQVTGGTGGAGGAGGMPGLDGKGEKAKSAETNGTTLPQEGTAVTGGTGGKGGWGAEEGGPGGLGGAPQMPILYVALFSKIIGGTGGAGGASPMDGGRGGDGEASKFASLLFPINERTRSLVPTTKLEDFNITVDLRQRLAAQGFKTVGGLFEGYDTDLPSALFLGGDRFTLKSGLRKFAARFDGRG